MNFPVHKSSFRVFLRHPVFHVSSSDIIVLSGDSKNVVFVNSKGLIIETWCFSSEIKAVDTSPQNELFVLTKDGNIGCISLPSGKSAPFSKKPISITQGEKYNFAYLPGAYKINYTSQGLVVCSYYTPICVYGISGSQKGLLIKRLSVEISTFDTICIENVCLQATQGFKTVKKELYNHLFGSSSSLLEQPGLLIGDKAGNIFTTAIGSSEFNNPLSLKEPLHNVILTSRNDESIEGDTIIFIGNQGKVVIISFENSKKFQK